MRDAFMVRDGKVFLVDGSDEPVEVKGGISPEGFDVVSLFRDGYLCGGYLRDKKGIWWYHQRNKKGKFVTQDAEGFRVLDDDYGLDGTHVYLEDRLIPGADPHSFSLMECTDYFARDRHRLYVKSGSHFFHFDGMDTGSLVANGSFVGDRHDLYQLSNSLRLSNSAKHDETVQYSLCGEHHMLLKDWFAKHHTDIVGWWHPDYPFNADGAEQIADDWYRTPNAVFFRETQTTMRTSRDVFNLVRNADPASFEPLDAFHARDAKSIFCRSRRIAGAHRPSFTPIKDLFGKDEKTVYFNGYAVEHADPAKFQVLASVVPLAKDDKHVYTEGFARTAWPFGPPDYILVALDDADAKSFQTFGERGVWAADDARVYLRGEVQKKLDAASFQLLVETSHESFASDANGLYRSNGKKVAGVDGASFKKLNDYWGTDGKVVFFFPTDAIQKTADAASFTVTDDQGGARDAAFEYRVENRRVIKTALSKKS